MILLFVIACIASGVFGAIHNQVSYTVSPEYFTKFKFEQFAIGPSVSGRQGAAIVGWHASWWMGIVIGIFLIPFGLLIRSTRAYFLWMLRVFGLVLAITASLGLISLMFSWMVPPAVPTEEYLFHGTPILDPASFLRAGRMHNASYLGGLIGTVVGMISILRRFLMEETGSAKILKRTQITKQHGDESEPTGIQN